MLQVIGVGRCFGGDGLFGCLYVVKAEFDQTKT